jgi:competence protein ComEA
MNRRFIPIALSAAVLLLSASLSFAVENATPEAASKASSKAKAPAKVKLVDINSAKAEELKKLPGIGDADAEKIIAGRPYGSKAWLVSHNILQADKYPAIQNLVIAKQPSNDAAKNAAIYSKKK